MNAERHEHRLAVAASAAAVSDAFTGEHAAIARVADATELTVWSDTWTWILPQLARLDAPFRVIDSPDRTAIATFARRLLDALERG
jgi:hypothetical protein